MADAYSAGVNESDLIFDVECFLESEELLNADDLFEWCQDDDLLNTSNKNSHSIDNEENNRTNEHLNTMPNISSAQPPSKPLYSLTLPIVPSNSIRMCFSDMFLNTMNSGDFQHIQDFFHTFMAKSCCFTSSQAFPLELQIPNQLVVRGPVLYAHYLVGLNTMYPDMVLKVHTSTTIYNPKTKLTRVTMEVEYNLTKTVHIPYELWIPPEHLLDQLHTARDVNHLTQLLQRSSICQDHLPNVATTASTVATCRSDRHTASGTPPSIASSAGEKKNSKRKRSADHKDGKGLTTSTSTRSPASISSSGGSTCSRSSGGSVSTTSASSSSMYVPASYIAQLHDAAVVLPQPLPLRVVGQLEILLDQTQHVMSMNMRASLGKRHV